MTPDDDGCDDGVDAAWDEEIRRRLDEIRSGVEIPIPWAEARRMIMADDDDAG